MAQPDLQTGRGLAYRKAFIAMGRSAGQRSATASNIFCVLRVLNAFCQSIWTGETYRLCLHAHAEGMTHDLAATTYTHTKLAGLHIHIIFFRTIYILGCIWSPRPCFAFEASTDSVDTSAHAALAPHHTTEQEESADTLFMVM
jgi:hypothetical protein